MSSQPPRHSVSVSGVITDDHGRALLIQRRDNHHWEPPGGVLELDEAIEDGLRREVREETGLDIEPDTLTGVYKNMNVLDDFVTVVVGGKQHNVRVSRAYRPGPYTPLESQTSFFVQTYLSELRSLITGTRGAPASQWSAPAQLFASPKAACSTRL